MFRAPIPLILLCAALAACPAPPSQQDGGTPGDAGTPDAGADAGTGPDGGTPFVWPVPEGPIAITPSPFWKNRIAFGNEPFAQGGYDQVKWVKFTVLMRDPTKVYFQDSRKYALHFEFATQHLNPFLGMTPAAFEAVSLHEAGQEAITGAVLFPPFLRVEELGIQLVRQDAYAKEMVQRVFALVKASIDGPAGLKSFYMPTYEQEEPTRGYREWLEARGIPVSSADRWEEGSLCYASGWALGRLTRLPPGELEAAYKDGRLKATDILLTDGVPAELPPLAGVISTRPSTPNSHVAILANTLGVPFVYTPHASEVAALDALAGKEVVLRTTSRGDGDACSLDVFALDPNLPAAVRAELLALKAPSPIQLTPKAHKGVFSVGVDALSPADIQYVGGKAAHFGLLRRAVPESAYTAVALTFDLWDDALAQPVGSGKTLAAEVTARLAPFGTYPPADLFALKQALADLRTLIRDQAQLSAPAHAAVRAALAGFDPNKRLRFRSSTNVEDAADFTGAGLYDSYSGCLADELDEDAAGPSKCDPTEPEERGVFRALRRTYASFFNDNAYLERLRHGVDPAAVGMGVLVHYSVPDETELANGVVTDRVSGAVGSSYMKVVTQPGAESVTNPTGTAQPEVVDINRFGGSSPFTGVDRVRQSSLVPLGSWVMTHPQDYVALADLISRVEAEYRKVSPTPDFSLDFEFKKISPGKLFLKQVRPLPRAAGTLSVVPFFLNRPRALCAGQGEYSDLMAIHRNKVRFSVTTRNVRLTTPERGQSLFGLSTYDYPDGDARKQLTGAPSSWPSFSHAVESDRLVDRFALTSPARTASVHTAVPELLYPSQTPILTTQDVSSYLTVEYTQPQPKLNYGTITTTTVDSMVLGSCDEDTVLPPGAVRQTRTFTGPNGLKAVTEFYWPPAPTGPGAGYTAPLIKWVKSELTGLTSVPLTLTSSWAQTYRPEHHNFSEGFLFDPYRDPATTAGQKAELAAKNVRWLLVWGSQAQSTFFAFGQDGQLRKLP